MVFCAAVEGGTLAAVRPEGCWKVTAPGPGSPDSPLAAADAAAGPL
ncbi:hypothetical protein GXW82_20285 [Streptacidiphilus sp. 4-A2]|nr:hypothetical protein [Streptacidiphilus sp. 4-A2]